MDEYKESKDKESNIINQYDIIDKNKRAYLAKNKKFNKLNSDKGINDQLAKTKDFIKAFVHVYPLNEKILAQIKASQGPKWLNELIEYDANPVNPMTDQDFAKLMDCNLKDMYTVRSCYPNYAMAVMYRRKKFMADLGNFLMKILIRRANFSDRALQMGLEMAGLYVPTFKGKIEELDSEEKKVRIVEMLKKVQVSIEKDNPTIETQVESGAEIKNAT